MTGPDPNPKNTISVDQLRASAPKAWEASEVSLHRALNQRLNLAFLGSASSGKDSAIRAIFGIDFGDISPIPGSTDRIKVATLDASGQVLIVNAPGFGDLRAEVDAMGRSILESVDIVLYLVNCEGGATIDERRDLNTIRALGCPILVCFNKIDLIRPHQREIFLAATLHQLGVERCDSAVCAFDPLPQLSPEPIGVDAVVSWIYTQLEAKGKSLLFAKQLRNKAAACEPILRSAAKKAAVAGAIPIPGADLAAVTAIQIAMIREIANIFSATIDRDVAMFIIGEILGGSMRGFVRWGVEALKTAGWIPGTQFAAGAILALSSAMAAGTTYGIGRAAIRYFGSGETLDGDALRAEFEEAAKEYQLPLAIE